MITDEIRRIQCSRPDEWATFFLDCALLWAAAATLAYDIVLISRMPAMWWYGLCGSVLIMAAPWMITRARRLPPWCHRMTGLAVLALFAAAVNLFTLRPDADDFSFFHRALVQVSNLAGPIAFGHTAHDISELPAISPFHLLTSFEVTGALVAHAVGLPPLATITLGLASIGAALVPLAYFCLIRTAGFSSLAALAGAVAAIGWLLVSRDVHQDWGNFTLLRIWQGKCLMVALHLPLCLLYTLRFLLLGHKADLFRLHLVIFTGIGLSGSALFLLPMAAATATGGFLAVARFHPKSLRRGGAIATILLEVAMAMILPFLGFLPIVTDISVWTGGNPDPIARLMVIATPINIALYVLLFVLALMAGQRRLVASAVTAAAAISVLLFITPPAATVLMDAITPAIYWRLIYTIPVPFAAGLAAAGLMFRIRRREGGGRLRLVSAMILVATVAAVWMAKTPTPPSAVFALPVGPKFPPSILANAEALAERAQPGALVLSPNEMVVVLALLRSDLKFVATRSAETLHVFANAGLASQGAARISLQNELENCSHDLSASLEALGLRRPIDIVVMSARCRDPGNTKGLVNGAGELLELPAYRVWLGGKSNEG